MQYGSRGGTRGRSWVGTESDVEIVALGMVVWMDGWVYGAVPLKSVVCAYQEG